MRPACSSPSTRTRTSSLRQREKTATVAYAYETLPPRAPPPGARAVGEVRLGLAARPRAVAALAQVYLAGPAAQRDRNGLVELARDPARADEVAAGAARDQRQLDVEPRDP